MSTGPAIGTITAVCAAIDAAADELNVLDGVAGDGDMGVTARNAAAAVLELLPGLDADTTSILRECGQVIRRRCPSTAGTLVGTGLVRAVDPPLDPHWTDAETLAAVLQRANDAIMKLGKARRGGRTMIDALAPAAEAARAASDAGQPVGEVLAAAAAAAAEGALATSTMTPQFGRARWLGERGIGHVDAGARLVALVLDAAAGAHRVPGPRSDPSISSGKGDTS